MSVVRVSVTLRVPAGSCMAAGFGRPCGACSIVDRSFCNGRVGVPGGCDPKGLNSLNSLNSL